MKPARSANLLDGLFSTRLPASETANATPESGRPPFRGRATSCARRSISDAKERAAAKQPDILSLACAQLAHALEPVVADHRHAFPGAGRKRFREDVRIHPLHRATEDVV